MPRTKAELIKAINDYVIENDLTELQRNVYISIDREGLTHKQTAEKLGMAVPTVDHKIVRARQIVNDNTKVLLEFVSKIVNQ